MVLAADTERADVPAADQGFDRTDLVALRKPFRLMINYTYRPLQKTME